MTMSISHEKPRSPVTTLDLDHSPIHTYQSMPVSAKNNQQKNDHKFHSINT